MKSEAFGLVSENESAEHISLLETCIMNSIFNTQVKDS